ncbi:MAG: hypothetical protein ABFS32_20190 [Bacteroidota bacterium]
MKELRIVLLLIIAGLITGVFQSCEKSIPKLLVNTWQLEKYYLNSADSTSGLIVSDYTEEFLEGRACSRSYLDLDGNYASESGTWEYDEVTDTLFINGFSSFNWIDNYSSVDNDYLIIENLTKDELWYSFRKSEDLHELHFVSVK